MELILAIAALCQISAGDKLSMRSMDNVIQDKQIECHRYYVKCIDKNDGRNMPRKFKNCIKERK